MAHANFHVALGVGLGTALLMPRIALAWLRREPLARSVGLMLLVAYGLGFWAIVPNLFGITGVTGALHTHALSDVFVLHRSIDLRSEDGGLMMGELALGALLVVHYLVIVAAVLRVSTTRPSS